MLCFSMTYVIEYYSEALQRDILSLPATLLARYLSLTDRMEKFGAHLGEPHTKALGNGLFELRLKGSEGIARVFYCTFVEKRIVMLHSYIKKSQKIPTRELNIAEQRLKDIKNAKSC
jgi:phage-related protein